MITKLNNETYAPKDKLYIAVCGLVDSGKSTFIKTATQLLTGMDLPVDSLCNEREKGITIRMSSILCPYKDVDIVFMDLPGHKEFKSEIASGLTKAAAIIEIVDTTREKESRDYLEFINEDLKESIRRSNKTYVLFSKSSENKLEHYDAVSNKEDFVRKVKCVLDDIIKRANEQPHRWYYNPEKTALSIIEQAFNFYTCKNPTVMCSYGKDSITLLYLLKKSGHLKECKVLYLESELDMKGISEDYKKEVEKFFDIKVHSFKGVPDGWNFKNHTVEEIMKAKVEAINKAISDNDSQFTFIGSRRHEGDGTRAKEKAFSCRDKDGKADLYESVLEMFGGGEITHLFERDVSTWANCRVSPILDYTEIDIWLTLGKYDLPICKSYFSKDGLRYRSLGDEDTTVPIPSNATNVWQIIEELKESKDTERICRAKQDNAGKDNMEKIRSKGFF